MLGKLLAAYLGGVVYTVIVGTTAGAILVGICYLLHAIFGG